MIIYETEIRECLRVCKKAVIHIDLRQINDFFSQWNGYIYV